MLLSTGNMKHTATKQTSLDMFAMRLRNKK
jgi:hypothetical protein